MAHRADRARVAPLAIFFVLAACVTAGGIRFVRSQEVSLGAQALAEVGSVATLQARTLALWRRERESDARLLLHDGTLLRAVGEGGRAPGLEALFQSLNDNGYARAFVVDPGGRVVASSGGRGELDERERDLFLRALESRAMAWNDFHADVTGVHLELAIPFSPSEDPARLAGELVLRVDPATAIFPVLDTWPVPRATAESLLVRREGEEVVFLSALELGHLRPLAQRLPLSLRDLPAARALRGEVSGAGVDYRGQHVFFAARPVAGSPWFVVSKVDRDEVLSTVRTQGLLVLGVELLLLVAAAAGVFLWWRMREAQLENRRRDTEVQAAEALRDSEERFRRGLLLAPFPAMIHAEDGSIVALSRRWATVSGYSLADAPTVAEWVARALGAGRARMKAHLEAVHRLGESVEEGEHELRTPAGETRIWDFSSSPLGRMADGRHLAITMAKDVTERKGAQAALAAEKERLAVTLRSIGDAVIATDVEARVAIMNNVAETLTGWTAAEALGQPLGTVFRILDEQSRRPVDDPVARVFATGRVTGVTNHPTLVSRGGREHSIADSGAPIQDAEGRVLGVVLVFRDVTDESRREAALARAQRMESLAMLAGGIAHDFNNILTGVLTNLALALEDPGSPSVTELLEDSMSAAERARGLTKQLLTFSKGGAPVRRVVEIKGVVRDTALFCAHGWSGVCRVEVEDDLWPARVDMDQVAQVIQNVVINGIEAMPGGGTIQVLARNVELEGGNAQGLPAGPYLQLRIADDGPGIPEALRERIFEPFFTTKQTGSGLGLAVSHSIVAKHEGHISVAAGERGGVIFDIYLPAEPLASAAAEAPAAPAAPLRGRILVMDDEEGIRRVLARILVAAGCEVVAAAHGEEAVARYQEARGASPFDAVIVDVTVPGGMGGVETLAALKRIDPHVQVIVSSGYSNDPVMASYAVRGFAAVLEKPYGAADVREVVGRVLASSTGT
jgi:PAS domain S-box-containing protein